ncbi:MAG TPA: PQQ-binding-like beta-propeller repeat protein [Blastocatellia bacterium]|nr:PQQ-binding-like beta-propeller repeat protein [Blastocatellia bacterium]
MRSNARLAKAIRPLQRGAIAACSLILLTIATRADNWPQWRGPRSQGVSTETRLPVTWSSTESVRWKTALPGPGHSSPITWGNRIFLTAYKREGNKLLTLAIDKATGKIVWEREVVARQIEQLHPTNAPASPTPATDGRYVYVYFGSFGLVCYDFEGKKIWEKPLGPFPNEWGSASSPVLHGNMLLLNCDTDAEDFLLALNKTTGETVWRTSRSNVNRSWSVPVIWNASGTDEIVISGSGRVKAYDAKDGKELWTVEGLTTWVTPTPVIAHGMLYVASNGPGGNVIMAIRPGGRGNVTNTHVAWRYDRSAPYSSSPVIAGDYLYAVKNGGVMTCLNARTGEVAWQQRIPAGGEYYASLIAADGKVYALSEEGKATVVAAKPTYELLGTNNMGERCMASPAISDGQIFIRSDNTFFCIGR